jgi:hypothetical protein
MDRLPAVDTTATEACTPPRSPLRVSITGSDPVGAPVEVALPGSPARRAERKRDKGKPNLALVAPEKVAVEAPKSWSDPSQREAKPVDPSQEPRSAPPCDRRKSLNSKAPVPFKLLESPQSPLYERRARARSLSMSQQDSPAAAAAGTGAPRRTPFFYKALPAESQLPTVIPSSPSTPRPPEASQPDAEAT